MIQKVENFGPRLDLQSLTELRSPHDRKVYILEPRPDHHISAQIAEARHGREYVGIEPSIHAATNCDWPLHVRSHRTVRRYDVHWITALRLKNQGHLPTLQEAVAAPRQVIDASNHHALARIKA